MNYNDFKKIIRFLHWSGSEEHHGRLFVSLCRVDHYGLKYGNKDRQCFYVEKLRDAEIKELYKMFKEMTRYARFKEVN